MISDRIPEVTVEFCGDRFELWPGDEIIFGRGSLVDIHIDDNPRLHRRFGRIYNRDGGWWLENTGNRLPLELRDRTSSSGVTLSSGRETAISFAESIITFEAGPGRYELGVSTLRLIHDEVVVASQGTATVDSADVPLSGDQRQLLLALAEGALRTGQLPVNLPSNKEIANRFGWTMSAFNRKLDRLCQKLDRRGVPGLVGDAGALATDRRRRLVEYTVKLNLLSVEDLADLAIDPEARG